MGPERLWSSLKQQASILEYSEVRRNCPEGVYIVPEVGHTGLWRGAIFTRQGPYSPALLRFSLVFPSDYPSSPPCIKIWTDVFHPLVAPLTTYTHTTGSTTRSGSIVHSGRFSPGQFNIFYKFRQWESHEKGPATHTVFSHRAESDDLPKAENTERVKDAVQSVSPSSGSRRFEFLYEPPSPMNALDAKSCDTKPALSTILKFVQDSFENELILDELDLDDAANPSALHAWKAYRQRVSALASRTLTPRTRNSLLEQKKYMPNGGRDSAAAWNWDGVWLDRVRKTLQASVADLTLYGGNMDATDPIHFTDLSDNDLQKIVDSYLPNIHIK